MASKKDFRVVKSFFAAWVERDGTVKIVGLGEPARWRTRDAAKRALRGHWANPEVFEVKGSFLK